MYNKEPLRVLRNARNAVIALSILAIFTGLTFISQTEIFAQDKSTSITCTGAGPCEKTECVNGQCETIATNSSNISSTSGSEEEKSDKETTIGDSLRERLSLRED